MMHSAELINSGLRCTLVSEVLNDQIQCGKLNFIKRTRVLLPFESMSCTRAAQGVDAEDHPHSLVRLDPDLQLADRRHSGVRCACTLRSHLSSHHLEMLLQMLHEKCCHMLIPPRCSSEAGHRQPPHSSPQCTDTAHLNHSVPICNLQSKSEV